MRILHAQVEYNVHFITGGDELEEVRLLAYKLLNAVWWWEGDHWQQGHG